MLWFLPLTSFPSLPSLTVLGLDTHILVPAGWAHNAAVSLSSARIAFVAAAASLPPTAAHNVIWSDLCLYRKLRTGLQQLSTEQCRLSVRTVVAVIIRHHHTQHSTITTFLISTVTLARFNSRQTRTEKSAQITPQTVKVTYLHYLGNSKPGNCVVSLKMFHVILPKKTKRSLTYHLVRVEPPFTVRAIQWIHQTGPRKGT